jgi:hypothetical protein
MTIARRPAKGKSVKLYKTMFHDMDHGLMVSWHASADAAKKALRKRQAERDQPQGVEAVEPVMVPTTKAGLLEWLNAHVTGDNG